MAIKIGNAPCAWGVAFPPARKILLQAGSEGWCTAEQDCGPQRRTSPFADSPASRDNLRAIGFG